MTQAPLRNLVVAFADSTVLDRAYRCVESLPVNSLAQELPCCPMSPDGLKERPAPDGEPKIARTRFKAI
jgi:hypothetical protein